MEKIWIIYENFSNFCLAFLVLLSHEIGSEVVDYTNRKSGTRINYNVNNGHYCQTRNNIKSPTD